MQLGYTIPLQRYLKMKPPPYGIPYDLRLCWEFHVLTMNGRASLVAVHASSRYAMLLYGLSKSDWMELPELFATELRRCFVEEGFTTASIERYFALASDPEITRTHGRRPVAFLNRAVDDLYALPVQMDESSLRQPQVSLFLNDLTCRAAGHEDINTARTFFHKDLSVLLERV